MVGDFDLTSSYLIWGNKPISKTIMSTSSFMEDKETFNSLMQFNNNGKIK